MTVIDDVDVDDNPSALNGNFSFFKFGIMDTHLGLDNHTTSSTAQPTLAVASSGCWLSMRGSQSSKGLSLHRSIPRGQLAQNSPERSQYERKFNVQIQ